jgi:hypothetical protein
MATDRTRAALGAEAVTPETQAAAAARDGFVTYDELRGPDLEAARWSPARLPLPTGGDHIPLDPNAELAVGEGEVQVRIPRFSLSHDTFQPADSAKYLIFSTRQFELPPDRPATFAVDLAVNNIGGEPGDFRRAMAAFHAFDFEVSKRVFAVCGTSTRVLALHEQLGARGAGDPSTTSSSRPTRTSTTTSPGFAPARSPSTGAARPRPGASTAARCTRPTAPSSPNAFASGSGSGRCCRSGTVAVARSTGRA